MLRAELILRHLVAVHFHHISELPPGTVENLWCNALILVDSPPESDAIRAEVERLTLEVTTLRSALCGSRN